MGSQNQIVQPDAIKALQAMQVNTAKASKLSIVLGNTIKKSAVILIQTGKNELNIVTNLNKAQNLVSTNFIKNSNKIKNWLKEDFKNLQLLKMQINKLDTGLFSIIKSANNTGHSLLGMCERVIELSKNMMNFYNISGNGEFKQLGSDVREYSKSLQELSAKIIGTTTVGTNFNGIFDGLANQIKPIKDGIEQLSATLFISIGPALDGISEKIDKLTISMSSKLCMVASNSGNQLTQAFKKPKSPIESAIDSIKNASDNTNKFFANTKKLKGAIENTIKVYDTAKAAIELLSEGYKIADVADVAFQGTLLANPIGIVSLAIMSAVVIIELLTKHWKEVTNAVSYAWTWFTNIIQGMSDVDIALSGPIAPILALIKYFKEIKEVVLDAFNVVKKFFGFGGSKSSGTYRVAGINKYASGGIANRPSIFGEAGPEMAIPLKKTPRNIGLLYKTAEILGVKLNKNAQKLSYVTQNVGKLNADTFDNSINSLNCVELQQNPDNVSLLSQTTSSKDSKGATPVQITYAPVYYGANTAEISTEFEKHKEEIKDLIEQYFAEMGRVAFE